MATTVAEIPVGRVQYEQIIFGESWSDCTS